ncbi:hydroxymethylbilane synthase [Halorientalis regularis]|jgi:hydroxymethylbilane synthase|uniref:Hydroxymethylbilane synthase n=1 Tax=Halorientalis regularis TaxID=660518 RepID=A0A1G7GLF5_9EURY|nr:hydroxymethylbilane synthase [Halorientalis regularis]SDE88893.1 hydroxymethylbilane synthase [Halorientalis regularis]
MTTDRTLRLATRGSDLALRQAATVRETLASRRQSVELVEVETTGDQIQDELIHRLGKTGAFVRNLDRQVLDGEVDAAIHSMKDVPTESPPELIVAGIPERGPAGDVLLTPDGIPLDDLPESATVGTASLRRAAELRAERPDLEIEPLRGNVDTRVEKLLAPSLQREHERRLERAVGEQSDDEDVDADDLDPDNLSDAVLAEIDEWFDGLHEIERRATEREVEVEYDAIVLAEAGLDRMGLLHAVEFERLPTDTFVPAPGQGALAVTALDDDVGTQIHDRLDHPPTRVATSVERIVLDELGGGCVAPIGVHATVQGAVVHTVVRVLSQDGTEEVATSRDLPVERHARAAVDLADDLREQGAADLIEQAKREEPDERKREDS